MSLTAYALSAALLQRQTLPPDVAALKKELDQICSKFEGRLGYHLRLLNQNVSIGNRDDQRFPSASTIKTAVMVEVFRQVESGRIKWNEKLVLPPQNRRNQSMWAAFLRDGISVDIDGLTNLMMNVSDNTATVMLSDHLGVENIEKTLLGLGLKNTAVTINVPPTNERLTKFRAEFRNMGVTTPAEMATLLELIYRRKAASPAACEKMIRIMQHQYWDDFIRSGVPVEVAVAAKVGALNRSRSDSAIVFSPTRPYILTIYTDNQKNQEWIDDNPGNVAIRQISNITWNRLHPKQRFTPAPGFQRYYPTGGGVE